MCGSGQVTLHQFSGSPPPWTPENAHSARSVLGLFLKKNQPLRSRPVSRMAKMNVFDWFFFLIIALNWSESERFAKDSRCKSKNPIFDFWRVTLHQFLPASYPKSRKRCFFGKIEFETYFFNLSARAYSSSVLRMAKTMFFGHVFFF